ncbi:MAG: SEC-C domain-containing protein [Oxalobacteraceae bacterium]|nr:MAG: SEC-C domain-containing protein [Oxalobacteraceae bacterium]
MNTRAPIDLNPRILDFCGSISPELPEVLKCEPSDFAMASECFSNVELQVERHGGRAILGWLIWDWEGVYTEAEFHAVWESADGRRHEISPHASSDPYVVFLQDAASEYKGLRVNNIRRAANENKVIADLIRLCGADFNRFGQLRDGVELVGREAKLYQSAQAARRMLVSTLESGANRNARCLCGSGERYKRCHEDWVHRVIDGLASDIKVSL